MTKTQLSNLALAKGGQKAITSLEENSETAEHCRTHYDVTLELLLRAAPWSFAIGRQSTARLADPEYGPWGRAYQLPTGCVQVLDVNGTDQETAIDPPFAIEGNQILTNDDECNVRFVRLVDDPNAYPSDFVECFASLLWARMLPSLTGNIELGHVLEQKVYRELVPRAASASMNESGGRRIDRRCESDLVNARWW